MRLQPAQNHQFGSRSSVRASRVRAGRGFRRPASIDIFPVGRRLRFPFPFLCEGLMSVSAKQLLRNAVEQLPEDATVEDAMDRLYFLSKVARGIEAADRGDVVPHEEARRLLLGDLDLPSANDGR